MNVRAAACLIFLAPLGACAERPKIAYHIEEGQARDQIALQPQSASPSVKLTSSERVQDAIIVVATLCVAGGTSTQLEVDRQRDGEVSLNDSAIPQANSFNFSHQEALGLVNGLKATLNSMSAQQMSEARRCMKPYIDKILNAILS